MANEIDIDFGSLNLNADNNIAIADIDTQERMAAKAHSIPKSDHSIIETMRRSSLIITVNGDIAGTDYDDLRTNIDTLKAGLYNGSQKFTMDDDRYIMAQLQSFNYKYVAFRTLAKWKAVFVAAYPYWLAEVAGNDSRDPTSDVTYNITNSGNAPARLRVRVTNGTGGAISDDIAFTNTTNGENFRWVGSLANAKVLDVDNRYTTDDFKVLDDGADAHTNYEGSFITLEPGVNAVKFTGPASVTVELDWRDTYI